MPQHKVGRGKATCPSRRKASSKRLKPYFDALFPDPFSCSLARTDVVGRTKDERTVGGLACYARRAGAIAYCSVINKHAFSRGDVQEMYYYQRMLLL